MSDASTDLPDAATRSLAVRLFNRTWELLENPARGDAGDREMLATAMASRLHWEGIGTDENLAAGDWLVAHGVAGQDEERDRWAAEARRTLTTVDDDEDRELIESQLATVPGLDGR